MAVADHEALRPAGRILRLYTEAVVRKLTESELGWAIERLRNPISGGKVEAARAFGVDTTLLIEQLKLSPAERARRMHALAQAAESARGAAHKQANEL